MYIQIIWQKEVWVLRKVTESWNYRTSKFWSELNG